MNGMKALNYLERRKQIGYFLLSFSLTALVLYSCVYVTLAVADRGVSLLENKHAYYNEVFKNQAELNFKMEELFKKLYSLKNKRRSIGEYKQMQKIITNTRLEISQITDSTKKENHYYKVYDQFLLEVRSIQSLLDHYDKQISKRSINIQQLEKCRLKYQKLNKVTKDISYDK